MQENCVERVGKLEFKILTLGKRRWAMKKDLKIWKDEEYYFKYFYKINLYGSMLNIWAYWTNK